MQALDVKCHYVVKVTKDYENPINPFIISNINTINLLLAELNKYPNSLKNELISAFSKGTSVYNSEKNTKNNNKDTIPI